MTENKRCCFCGAELKDGWGNNPDPANTMDDAQCCDCCNANIVIPARIYIMKLIHKHVNTIKVNCEQ